MRSGGMGRTRPKGVLGQTRPILRAASVLIIGSRHVLTLFDSEERRQEASLLEHCRDPPDLRGSRAAAARALPGRDQRFAGIGLAQVDRRPGRGSGAAAHVVAVSRGPLRRIAAGYLDRPSEADGVAAAAAAPIGRVLAGAAAVAGGGGPRDVWRNGLPLPPRES